MAAGHQERSPGVGGLDGHSDRESRPPSATRVAELAASQWGVVSRAQLRALSVTGAAVDVWVRRDRLHLLHRGVYAVGHRSLQREGRWLAAVLACGEGAVLSHRSAAAHLGLVASGGGRLDVTAPRTRAGIAGVRVHRSRCLDARDMTTHDGIPVTSVARTLLDLAAIVRSERLERALAQAERLQVYDHAQVLDVLARANGHRGAAVLARATAIGPQLTRSELEVRLLKLVREAGLPEPTVNAVLEALDHGPCEVDFHWPAHHLVVETDGYETHGTRVAFELDRRKDAALVAAGYTVLRFTWREIEDRPATVVERLRAGCSRACAAGPPGAWSAASRAP